MRPQLDLAWGRYWTRRIGSIRPTARINGQVFIGYPEHLTVGDHVRIGRGCYLFCLGGLSIGDNTQISRNVVIYTANHDYRGTAVPYDDQYECKPVRIGASVWVGMNVCIAPGVTVGDGAIIGMGTVIAADVPEGAIVVGARQRIVGTRDMSDFASKAERGRFFGQLWPEL